MFLKNKNPIIICDIGASPIDKTDFIENLMYNTFSKLIGLNLIRMPMINLIKIIKIKNFITLLLGMGKKRY